LAAAHLYHIGQVNLIIATGGVPKAGQSEAAVISQICQKADVPMSAIKTEDKSRTTWENVQNARALLPHGAKIILVTDSYHMLRARLAAAETGLKATPMSPPLRPTSLKIAVRAYLREGGALLRYGVRYMKRLARRKIGAS
jgi:uncharacterized SAM-binding protein YcdF (DUF218 family)